MTTTQSTPFVSVSEALNSYSAAFVTPGEVRLELPLSVLAARLRWACGMNTLTAPALKQAAADDVQGDAKLCVALHLPPEEFAAWLLADDLGVYCLTEATGCEAWAAAAAARVRGMASWPQF